MSDSSSIGKVHLDLETNYSGFQQQLNGISGKATNMASKAFGKLGGIMAATFAVTKLVQFGKACINVASDLEEVQNVVDVVFGESANQINNFAKTAITSYGLSELSAKQYASTMGAMLKSMGLSDDAVLGMSQSITALAGDMASFYNLDSSEAFNKIRAGISGETEPLKQLGINMSVANMEAYALSQGITKSYQSMTQSEQALLRYKYLLSTTADAQGDFARTSNSWSNQTRILKEQLNSLKATLGSSFIQVLAPLIKMLNWVISKLQIAANYFAAFVEAFTGVKAETSSASSGMTDIADSATEAGDATVEAAKKASKALASFDKLNVLSSSSGDDGSGDSGGAFDIDLSSFGNQLEIPEPDTSGAERAAATIKGVFSDLKRWVTTSFAPSIKSWGKAFTDLKQPVKDAAKRIALSTKDLWDNTIAPFGEYLFNDWTPGIVNSINETVAPLFTDVMAFALDEFANDFEWTCQRTDAAIEGIFKPAMESVKNITVDALAILKDEWAKSGDNLLEKLSKVSSGIKDIWSRLYDTIIIPIVQTIVGAVDELWNNHLKGLWSSLLSFFSKLGEAVMTIWNNFLAPLIKWLIDVFGPYFVKVFKHAWETISAVMGNIIDAAKNILKALGGLLDFITGVFSGDWKKAWNGIKTFFKGVWDALVDIVKSPINLIISFINKMLSAGPEAVNSVLRALNKLSFKVPDWVPKYGGEKWGFNLKEVTPMQIPYLARGGIIDQPTLAMVGERGKEAVVPLENTAFADSIANAIMRVLMPLFANKGIGQNNNDEGTTVIVLKVGEYELGRITVDAINKYHNVIGKVELEV